MEKKPVYNVSHSGSQKVQAPFAPKDQKGKTQKKEGDLRK